MGRHLPGLALHDQAANQIGGQEHKTKGQPGADETCEHIVALLDDRSYHEQVQQDRRISVLIQEITSLAALPILTPLDPLPAHLAKPLTVSDLHIGMVPVPNRAI